MSKTCNYGYEAHCCIGQNCTRLAGKRRNSETQTDLSILSTWLKSISEDYLAGVVTDKSKRDDLKEIGIIWGGSLIVKTVIGNIYS